MVIATKGRDMKDDIETVCELLKSAALARFRVLRVEGEEDPDRSWQRITCHVHREDVSWGTLPLIYTLGALSFGDARPRGSSEIDYDEKDEWRIADMVQRLRFDQGSLVLETDYVRGRMMKTTVTVAPHGKLVLATRNRHEMATRWLDALKGKKHIRLVGSRHAPTLSPSNPRGGANGRWGGRHGEDDQ